LCCRRKIPLSCKSVKGCSQMENDIAAERHEGQQSIKIHLGHVMSLHCQLLVGCATWRSVFQPQDPAHAWPHPRNNAMEAGQWVWWNRGSGTFRHKRHLWVCAKLTMLHDCAELRGPIMAELETEAKIKSACTKTINFILPLMQFQSPGLSVGLCMINLKMHTKDMLMGSFSDLEGQHLCYDPKSWWWCSKGWNKSGCRQWSSHW